MNKICLCGLSPEEILKHSETDDFTINHAVAVANSIYKKRISDIARFERIPSKLKNRLLETSSSGIFKPVSTMFSKDLSVKYLFKNDKGLQYETVYIPDKNRHTVCVSTQSGCRMGCTFCFTGRSGFYGNLPAGEIINQIISIPEAPLVNHVVFMGMGEPLDNLQNVLKACKIITAGWGLAISPRNVTVSTVGLTSEIRVLLESSECNITLSLFSPFSCERKQFVPAEKLHPASGIIEILKSHPLRKKRRLSVAYVMISGVNDTEKHLEGLKNLIRGSAIRVNLIPYHPGNDDKLKSSSCIWMQHFKHELVVSGVSASIRKSRGSDIAAACGLLASTSE